MANDEVEIERSWVIKSLPEESLIDHSLYNEIGYLFSKNGELRVYRKRLPGKWKYGITVKEDGDLSRKEWEDKLFPEWAFNVVWPNTLGARVYKTRHFVYHDSTHSDLFVEVDQYCKALKGLIRMEREFSSEHIAAEFVLPNWAVGAIEVTNDSRFKGKNLAKLSQKEFKKLIIDTI